MKREIDSKFFIGLIAVVVIVVGIIAWRQFGARSGQMTAAQAGLGKPMHPGEIPGRQAPVTGPASQTPGP